MIDWKINIDKFERIRKTESTTLIEYKKTTVTILITILCCSQKISKEINAQFRIYFNGFLRTFIKYDKVIMFLTYEK